MTTAEPYGPKFDVQRLLEKYYADIRHIETERHWFLAAYSIVVAGVLAFLGQDDQLRNFVFGFASLTGLTIVGFLHAFRASFVLNLVQKEVKAIVGSWDCAGEFGDTEWSVRWLWPTLREPEGKHLSHWHGWLQLPLTFTTISLAIYILTFALFTFLLVRNTVAWVQN